MPPPLRKTRMILDHPWVDFSGAALGGRLVAMLASQQTLAHSDSEVCSGLVSRGVDGEAVRCHSAITNRSLTVCIMPSFLK